MMKKKTIDVVYEPIRQALPALKSKSWLYKIHPYFTRQPLNVVEEYIRHFCPKNGLVLDPFCGSGVVAAAALANKRKAICLDIDPLACFISTNTCETDIDCDQINILFMDITKRMSRIIKFIESASRNEIASYKIKKWVPTSVKLPLNADRQYVDEMFTRRNLIIMSHLLDIINDLSDEKARQFFLFTFSSALDKMSIMYRAPEQDKTHGGGSGLFLVYRYWVPPNPGTKDAWTAFSESFARVLKAKQVSIKLFGDYAVNTSTFFVYNDSADNLNRYVKEASIDYIFTDPPYGAHIAYLDLSTMYRAWLKLPFEDDLKNKEAIEGGNLSHTNEHYLKMLSDSFEKMFIALKDDAWMSLVYFHKNPNLWYSIRDMMKYIGFTYVNVVAQPLSNKSFHKVKRPLRVLGESLIVNFKKSSKRIFSVPMSLPLANIIKNVAERVIYKNSGATTEEILREVVPDLFENELFIDAATKSMSDILGILESDFDIDGNNLWQIRSERK
jgi:DNA modification methylase